ncbi:hypothetical protein O3P69_015925 [Scylla paramamosain]|uniref:C-type lectin domain-containing protein n=2 Tax=Scylla paramamosain TaxID=85552 RepID=A0AAW0T9B8_SCYPA
MGRGEGAVPTKGVGGYRPTINWREISVRRRSVAARQVLACIIVSGVVIVAAGILLTVLGFLVIASQCPFMWREGAGSCYYLAPHNASWEEGRSYCTSQSAALLHLHSRTEAEFITEVMSGRSWLGARRKHGRDNAWAWADSGTPLNYTRWAGSEPASLQQDLCAAVEPSGAWVAVACSDGETAYVICDYVPGYNPFMLVGPVVAVCGVVVLVLSVEVCVRRREFITKNPEAITDDQDDDRQVEAPSGVVNPGFSRAQVFPASSAPPAATTAFTTSSSTPSSSLSTPPATTTITTTTPATTTSSPPEVIAT